MANKKWKIVCIILFVVLVVLCIGNFGTYMAKEIGEEKLEAKIEELKENLEEAKEEIKELAEENEKLLTGIDGIKKVTISSESDSTTYQQAMRHLSDIYLLIEKGKEERAREELKKFDESTFDDTVRNFKKALLELAD